jgi:hypothetical protein
MMKKTRNRLQPNQVFACACVQAFSPLASIWIHQEITKRGAHRFAHFRINPAIAAIEATIGLRAQAERQIRPSGRQTVPGRSAGQRRDEPGTIRGQRSSGSRMKTFIFHASFALSLTASARFCPSITRRPAVRPTNPRS